MLVVRSYEDKTGCVVCEGDAGGTLRLIEFSTDSLTQILPSQQTEYERLSPGHPAYDILQRAKRDGAWMCDAIKHDSHIGCPNPICHNHIGAR